MRASSGRLLREFALPTLSHLVLAMMKPDAHHLRSRVAQAVTVQESYFFRDKVPFSYFIDVMLPTLMAKREKERRIRVWCAAAATGQEPYSLAMELAEAGQQAGRLDGRDRGHRFRRGCAQQGAQRRSTASSRCNAGLPVSLLVKYFSKVGNCWEISPDIRRRVSFRTHNLLDGCQELGMFDVIFCRNVLIYVDDATKRAILAQARVAARSGRLSRARRGGDHHGLSDEFMAVPERHHGLFRFTPQAAAAAEARPRKSGWPPTGTPSNWRCALSPPAPHSKMAGEVPGHRTLV